MKPAPPTIILAILTPLVSLGPLFRVEPFTRVISAIIALQGLMVVAATYQHGYWVWFRLFDYLTQFLTFLGAAFSRALSLDIPFKGKKQCMTCQMKEMPANDEKINWFWSIFRGVGLALPIIFVFSALFAAADPIFENKLQQFLDFLKIENLVEYLFRFFYILLFAYIFTGVLLHAIYPEHKYRQTGSHQTLDQNFPG